MAPNEIEEQKKQVRAAHDRYLIVQEIADETGIDYARVARLIASMGLKGHRKGDRITAYVQANHKTQTVAQMAKTLERVETTIYQALKRLGIHPKACKWERNRFEFDGDTCRIWLKNIEQWCVIDAEDYERVKDYTWGGTKKKTDTTPYVKTACRETGRTILLHRLLMSPPDELEIDHIDWDGLNNRKSNLRIVTHKVNAAHRNQDRPIVLANVAKRLAEEKRAMKAKEAREQKVIDRILHDPFYCITTRPKHGYYVAQKQHQGKAHYIDCYRTREAAKAALIDWATRQGILGEKISVTKSDLGQVLAA